MREEIGDEGNSFELLAQALVAHVDAATLDAIEIAAGSDGRRAEAILTRALEEVFDGPLVRQLIGRRASIRQDKLGDVDGALADLKKLHELAPADTAITERYSALLTGANDYRGLVHLLEDQILRSKDQGMRADLARQIARLWEERIGEAREAADAWRRVLRLKPQDPEATTGLDRAKRNKLNFDPAKHPPQRPPAVAPSAPPEPIVIAEPAKPAPAARAVSSAPPRAHHDEEEATSTGIVTMPRGEFAPPASVPPPAMLDTHDDISSAERSESTDPETAGSTEDISVEEQPAEYHLASLPAAFQPHAEPEWDPEARQMSEVTYTPPGDSAPPMTTEDPMNMTFREDHVSPSRRTPPPPSRSKPPGPPPSTRPPASRPGATAYRPMYDDDNEDMATMVGDSASLAQRDAHQNFAPTPMPPRPPAELQGASKTDEVAVANVAAASDEEVLDAAEDALMIDDDEIVEVDEGDVVETGEHHEGHPEKDPHRS